METFEIISQKHSEEMMVFIKNIMKIKPIEDILEDGFSIKTLKFNMEKNSITIKATKDDEICKFKLVLNIHGYDYKVSRYQKLDKKRNYKDDIYLLYQQGVTQKQIASKLNCSQAYVSKILKNR